jgi:Thioredoxin
VNTVVEDRPDFLFDKDSVEAREYRIVEFYVHWCDVCRIFAPRYVQLGKILQQKVAMAQSPLPSAALIQEKEEVNDPPSDPPMRISVHAVSCAPNRPMCRALAVDRYPMFRIYRPGDVEGMDVPHAQLNAGTVMADDDDHSDNSDTAAERGWGAATAVANAYSSARSLWLEWGRGRHPEPRIEKYGYRRSRDELRDDVHRSLYRLLREGVYVADGRLPPNRADALFD